MYKFKKEEMKVPCYVWSKEENVEKGAIEQIVNASSLPFVFHHTAMMPDCHQGFGIPIGGVIATQGVVVPAMVGVDIGCGMATYKTNLEGITEDQLKKIMGKIREAVPVGFNHHKEQQMTPKELLSEMQVSTHPEDSSTSIVTQEIQKATYQVGTLGGGNHFIEIQKDENGYIWIMIHSGSRNIGYKVAKYYNDIAKELNKEWYCSVPKEHDLAFLPLESEDGQNYIREMKACLNFAALNRRTMIERVFQILREETGASLEGTRSIHHNYATMENHFGKNVMVHRKGATSARDGEIGIIPGSQGTSSYIVSGKGNPESFKSCSHGAGRKMGRRAAQKDLDLKEEQAKLEAKGILHSVRDVKNLDEAPGSYKDIEIVMEEQKDLVDIVTKLTPLAVVKG